MYEQYTDEQIVEMLVPKLKKSVPELNWDEYLKRPSAFSIWNRLISVIYKSGYIRGQLGRSFIIGEKKKKSGHWEPVDPNNLPKEGTKVRYSRECKVYKNHKYEIVIGDTGVVNFEGLKHDWFGIKLDNPRNLYYNWLSFGRQFANCLDMWVEGNE